ncbi:MAG: sulfite exporter TauE/SafE family protein [Thalassovita sp.]
MELDWGLIAFAAPAVVFAGISKGGFGSGASFAAAAILALVLEPGQAIGIMLPLLMLMDVSALKPFWGKWSWPEARLLILGSLPGLLVGGYFYHSVNADVFRIMIGVIAIGFVLWQGALKLNMGPNADRPMPVWAGAIAGAVAGFTSFVSHAGGPPAAVYLLSRGLAKTPYQATTVLAFWTINLLKFIPYFMLGIFTAQTFLIDLVLAPFAVIGVWIGVRLHFRIPERLFFVLTYILLLMTGAKLIFDGLT